ncbi:tetratricopeptide repeat protein [Elusimicrobiota bacterium]
MKADKKVIFILLAISLLYLVPQAFTGLYVGDSGELIAAAKILGNAHPPGYPLFSLVGKLFLLFPASNPAYRMNMAQSVLGSIAVILIFLIVRFVLSGNKGAAGLFGALFLLGSGFFVNQCAVAEVFMLNLVMILLVLYALLNRKYAAAGLFAGIGLGNQHTLVLIFPAVLYLILTDDDRIKDSVRFFVWMMIGLTVYIYLPVRAAALPPLNWGDPSSAGNFLRVLMRRDYGTLSLHGSMTPFSISKGADIVRFFFEGIIKNATVPGFIAFIVGTVILLKERRKLGAAVILIFIFSGPVFFLMTNMKIDAAGESILERFFLLPYIAVVLGSCGVFLMKPKVKYALFLLPLFLGVANFRPGSGKVCVLSKYIEDVVKTLDAEEPLYITRGGVGDDLIFGLTYLKWAENRLSGLKVYSQYASIFEGPAPVRGKAAFATFSPETVGHRLFQEGLIFKTYPQGGSYMDYGSSEWGEELNYRQRNIAVNYPFFKGRWHILKGEMEQGEAEFEKALELGGDIAWLLNNMGNVYRRARLNDRSLEFYKRAVEIDPYLGEGYNNIGNIYFKRKMWMKAVGQYLKAISIEPDAVRYYNLALTYLSMQEYREAEKSFRQALKYNPQYVSAYNDLGLVYLRTGELEKAAEVFEEGLKLDSDNINLVFNAALAYEKAGSAGADAYWEKYLEIARPDDPDRKTAVMYLRNK